MIAIRVNFQSTKLPIAIIVSEVMKTASTIMIIELPIRRLSRYTSEVNLVIKSPVRHLSKSLDLSE